ncbi:TatD family hydrolase [Candidatus Omnitrophota bacterium]
MIQGLIDTHAHLDQVDNLPAALERAHQSSLATVIAVATNYASSIKTLQIANEQSPIRIFPALGVHPSDIEEESLDQIIELIEENHKNIVAVGEIGLDYWYKPVKKDKSKREDQKEFFLKQLQTAKRLHLPVIIHSRGAWADCLELCRQTEIEKAVFHWYSGPIDVLEEILKRHYLISATPSLFYSSQHQEAVMHTPLESLLIETDSPVFYKDGEEGFSAEPKDVIKTLRLVSELKKEQESVVAERVVTNAKKFFNIA